jgi:iron complex transport system ATP-binding protein
MALTVSLEELAFGRSARPLAEGLNLAFAPGSVTVLAGPNGAGKSTLLECIAGDLPPLAGRVEYEGVSLARLSLSRRAQLRAMLCQQSDISFDFPVAEVVAMGLSPHGIDPASDEGRRLVRRAIDDLELGPLADRLATRLSGGEAQRVHIARMLVQLRAGDAAVTGGLLLLDEPTTGLDYRHQLALLGILRQAAAAGTTVIATLHDLPLACRLADRMLLIGAGRLVADVHPSRLDPALVGELYRIPASEVSVLLRSVGAPLFDLLATKQ